MTRISYDNYIQLEHEGTWIWETDIIQKLDLRYGTHSIPKEKKNTTKYETQDFKISLSNFFTKI